MTGRLPAKMDVRSAWNAWAESGSQQAAADFLDRIESWTDGTAAQLTRGSVLHDGIRVTREEVADRLRYHLGVVASGESVTYVEALDRARRQVISELLPRLQTRP